MKVKFKHNNDWQSGLMGCCEDMHICCCVYWCPCIVGCEVDKAIGVIDLILRNSFKFNIKYLNISI